MTDIYAPSLLEAELDFVFFSDEATPTTETGVQRFSVGPNTKVELDGSKQSQRLEVTETGSSDDLNTANGPVWYHWSVFIEPTTQNPSDLDIGSKLHLGQFHQRAVDGTSDAPALMFNLLENGDLVAQFEQSVGKRSHVLVEGGLIGESAKGHWVDIVVGADWRLDGGWTEFYIRQEGEADFRFVAHDSGPNTSTGQVYFKYGVYRSFLERDPILADSVSAASFKDVVRGDSFFDAVSSDTHLDLFSPNETAHKASATNSVEPTEFLLDHFDFG